MDVFIKEVRSGSLVQAEILPAEAHDMPLKKDGWNFNWRQLFRTEGARFYKLVLKESPPGAEGVLMFSIVNGEIPFMNNIEVSPGNFGGNGRFDFVAGCLIAYACRLSFLHGKNHYTGFLSFESKTALIEFYRKKYGATWAMGQKMFFDPVAGRQLMEQYLGIVF